MRGPLRLDSRGLHIEPSVPRRDLFKMVLLPFAHQGHRTSVGKRVYMKCSWKAEYRQSTKQDTHKDAVSQNRGLMLCSPWAGAQGVRPSGSAAEALIGSRSAIQTSC